MMKIKEAILETVCGITSKLPENKCFEVALAGKSNVGKSSLINNLVNRKSLARTSGEPGKTQTINYYKINSEFYLVDLPGYGYARVSKETQEKWGKMIENYLVSSKMLKCIFLLVDIRHNPSDNDKMMYDWIVSMGYKPVVIATKADKLKRSEFHSKYKNIRTGLGLSEEDICIAFSAQNGLGREEILNTIEKLTDK